MHGHLRDVMLMPMENVVSKSKSPLHNNDMEAGHTCSVQDYLVGDRISVSDLENSPKAHMVEDFKVMGGCLCHLPHLTGIYCSQNHNGGVEPQLDLQRDGRRCPDVPNIVEAFPVQHLMSVFTSLS